MSRLQTLRQDFQWRNSRLTLDNCIGSLPAAHERDVEANVLGTSADG